MTHFYAVIATTEETALSQFNLFSPKMSCCIVQNETDFFSWKSKDSNYFSKASCILCTHFFSVAQDGLWDVSKQGNGMDHKMPLVFLRKNQFISVAKQIKGQGSCCRSNRNIPLCCS